MIATWLFLYVCRMLHVLRRLYIDIITPDTHSKHFQTLDNTHILLSFTYLFNLIMYYLKLINWFHHLHASIFSHKSVETFLENTKLVHSTKMPPFSFKNKQFMLISSIGEYIYDNKQKHL